MMLHLKAPVCRLGVCGKNATHRCSRCKADVGFYCSVACQSLAWPEHKVLCGTIRAQALSEPVSKLGFLFRLAALCLILLKNKSRRLGIHLTFSGCCSYCRSK